MPNNQTQSNGGQQRMIRCGQFTIPIAGLIACVAGTLLVLGVLSVGVLTITPIFIPCLIVGTLALVYLLVGTFMGTFFRSEEDPETGETATRFRLRRSPSSGAIRRRINIIDRLPHISVDNIESQDEKMCTICLCEDTVDRVVLSCDHKFHEDCIKQWVSRARSALCPVCRSRITACAGTPAGDRQEPVVSEAAPDRAATNADEFVV